MPPTPRSRLIELSLLLAILAPSVAMLWMLQFGTFSNATEHLAVVHTLKALAAGPSAFDAYFRANLQLSPYSLYYHLMLWLSDRMSLWAAHKLMGSALIVLFAGSLYFVCAFLAPERRLNALLFAPLSVSGLSIGGLQAFALALPPALTAWALICRDRTEPRLRVVQLAAAAGLLLMSAAAHPLGPVVGGVAAAVYLWRDLLRPRVLTQTFLAFLPCGIYLLYWWAKQSHVVHGLASAGRTNWMGLNDKLLFLLAAFWALTPFEILTRAALVGLLLWGAVKTARDAQARRDPLFRVAVTFLVLHICVPGQIQNVLIAHRAAALALMMAILAVRLPSWLTVRTAFALALASSIASVPVQRWAGEKSDAVIADALALQDLIPRGGTLLPISFLRSTMVFPAMGIHQPWSALVVSRDAITPYVFAVGGPDTDSGAEFRQLIYTRVPNEQFLPASSRRAPAEVLKDEVCHALGIDTRGEDCGYWRRLRYLSFVWNALAYDRTLVIAAPADFLKIINRHMVLEGRHGFSRVFRPRTPGARPALDTFMREDPGQ